MESPAEPTLRTARIIAGALVIGPVLFWITGSFLIDLLGGGIHPPGSSFTPAIAMWVWLAVAVPSFVAGLFFRRKAVGVVEGSRVGEDPEAADQALAEIQTWLMIAWALFEGPALMSGVFFLLFATANFLWSGVALLGIGMFMSFPRREWYEPFGRVRDRASRAMGVTR